jgi:acyl-CoA thioester hydrolase
MLNMQRIKIQLPETAQFNCNIPVLIQHVNYGNHLGNDSVVSILHEARVRWLASIACTELNVFGTALIMADLAVEYKAEAFYGDDLKIDIFITDLSKIGFSVLYKISKQNAGSNVTVVVAKTGMLCFNYETRKISSLPIQFVEKYGIN